MTAGAARHSLAMAVGALAVAVGTTAIAYAVAVHPPALTDLLLVLAGVVAVGISMWRPDAGTAILLSLMLLVPREVLFERGVPGLGGRVKVTDLLLAVIVTSWLIRRELGLTSRRLPQRRLVIALGLFFLAVAGGLLTARTAGTQLTISLQELRPLLAYLLVFPIVGEVRSIRDLRRGLWFVTGVAALSSLLAIAEYLTAGGPGDDDAYGGLVRVLDDAFLGPMVAVISVAALYPFSASGRERIALVAAGGLGIAGLFVTFQRTAWVAAALGVVVIVMLLAPRYRRRLRVAVVGVALVAGVAAYATTSTSSNGVDDPVNAGITRIESIAAFENDPSAEHRYAEWRRAIALIEEHPLSGIGLGSGITFYSPLFRAETDTLGNGFATYYIHSSYLWFPLKIGLLGAAAFLAMLCIAVASGYRTYRFAATLGAQPLVLTSLAGLAALVLLSVTGPHLNYDRSTTYAAVLIGVLEVLRHFRTRARSS